MMLIYARVPYSRVTYNELIPALSLVQTVMIVDGSFNFRARLNTNSCMRFHRLSSIIIIYHVIWTSSNLT